MSKKPDYSSINIPAITAYCNKNGLLFNWKNEEQGHAVIYNDDIEAYIWVQRMTVGMRKKHGIELSKTFYDSSPNKHFSKKWLDNILFKGIKLTTHTTKDGIKVTIKPSRLINEI